MCQLQHPLWMKCNKNVVGLVSGAEGCGDPKKPGVYTRLSEKHMSWINKIIKGQSNNTFEINNWIHMKLCYVNYILQRHYSGLCKSLGKHKCNIDTDSWQLKNIQVFWEKMHGLFSLWANIQLWEMLRVIVITKMPFLFNSPCFYHS